MPTSSSRINPAFTTSFHLSTTYFYLRLEAVKFLTQSIFSHLDYSYLLSFFIWFSYNVFFCFQSAAVDGMKVGRSIISFISKNYETKTLVKSEELEKLSDSIESVTAQLVTSESRVDEIVSYQSDMVYDKDRVIPPVIVPQILNEKVTAKPKGKSSLLKKLLSKKSSEL